MKPVGFWPADEGGGAELRDLAAAGNHAKAFNTPWAGNLLDFSGGFEFVEIPDNPAYRSKAFSLGAWVFVRRPRPGPTNASRGTHVFGNWSRDWRLRPGPISLRLTGKEKLAVEVVSDKKEDALGSRAAGIRIEPETWQHLLYTYRDGEGTLFVNGQPVCSKKGIVYTPQKGEYIAGSDSGWWYIYPPRCEALDGSLRGLVLFDRAVSEAEAAALAGAGKPLTRPRLLADDELRLHGRFIKLRDLTKLTPEDQRLALRFLCLDRYGWPGSLEANAGVLKPYLARALRHPLTRYDAARVLKKMSDDQILAAAKPHLISSIAGRTVAPADRATAALALARLGPAAGDALATLVALLREDIKAGGVHVPRVEDAFRNALITALLAIDRTNGDVRRVLGEVYAKPILAGLDLTTPYMGEVRDLVAQQRFMDALDACRLVIKKHKLFFRSQNDPSRDQRPEAGNPRAYTAADAYKGCTYAMGEGEAWKGCTAITRADYERALGVYSNDYPGAARWLGGNVAMMFRADLKKTAPDGTVQTVYMGGENFIFSGRDIKIKAWSVAVDKTGYIHVMGGQHNCPHYSEFMPGAWESLGLSGDREAPNHPTTLYWVSKRPEDITEFEFVGRKGHPGDLPAPFMNYMNFVQDRKGELYLYGRNDKGIQNWAFYRYDADARRWLDLGGARAAVVQSARKANPEWVRNVEQALGYGYRGLLPSGGREEYPSLAWAWQPHFYNYIRSTRGVQFDPDNRLYVQIPIYAYDANKEVREAELFAYSDDGAKTFHRADGSPVELPLTSNPAPEHNADILNGYNEIWLDQWTRLITRVGFAF
ncbi:MAG: hypothetical protein JXR37_04160 [Kiritimatiellae bacterium]|nr:hypothetical protein [Kiritimatiellia bacterium]